ncbi:MAG: DUF3073 domain-containing protein [Actinomycetota bacterium]|nr:DUF3073 domain-containing protein [Actinomycetota bacterium]
MGRGRAKAKQTKVARELKYGGPGFEVDRLKAELSGAAPSPFSPATKAKDDEDDDDEHADPYAADDDDR